MTARARDRALRGVLAFARDLGAIAPLNYPREAVRMAGCAARQSLGVGEGEARAVGVALLDLGVIRYVRHGNEVRLVVPCGTGRRTLTAADLAALDAPRSKGGAS